MPDFYKQALGEREVDGTPWGSMAQLQAPASPAAHSLSLLPPLRHSLQALCVCGERSVQQPCGAGPRRILAQPVRVGGAGPVRPSCPCNQLPVVQGRAAAPARTPAGRPAGAAGRQLSCRVVELCLLVPALPPPCPMTPHAPPLCHNDVSPWFTSTAENPRTLKQRRTSAFEASPGVRQRALPGERQASRSRECCKRASVRGGWERAQGGFHPGGRVRA